MKIKEKQLNKIVYITAGFALIGTWLCSWLIKSPTKGAFIGAVVGLFLSIRSIIKEK